MSHPSGQESCTKYFQFKSVLLADGWITPGYIGIDEAGTVQYISSQVPDQKALIEPVNGLALPGFQNCHSHAFQYAMAGMAEKHSQGTRDDFWSWREAMYQCALRLDPDQIQIVATALYIEMLKRGYTHVAEFHYLHHDKNGNQYTSLAETSVSLLAAAAVAGIKITLIPVFYQRGGFGMEAQPRQRRFIFRSVEDYFRLLDEAGTVTKTISCAELGFGVHSLRAAEVKDVLRIFAEGPKDLPFHLHAAEQLKEVEDSVSKLGQRPVEWILKNLEVSKRVNIVHCTHLNDFEIEKLAVSGANVVLCPGTEGNLGDGIFRLTEFANFNGNWCIGTDSHISLNPLEDLRWLDYGQRLITHRRNTFNDGGVTMIRKSFLCGSNAMGTERKDFFEVGKSLDAVVYDTNARLLNETNDAYSLSRIIYTADSGAVLGTLINGKWIIKDLYHHEEESVGNLFRQTLRAISIG
jgi:formimidoylglutamate deiminase